MADGFLKVYLGMVVSRTLLGVVIGMAFAKQHRKKGEVYIGAIVGVVLGSVFASVTAFDTSSSEEEPTAVVE